MVWSEEQVANLSPCWLSATRTVPLESSFVSWTTCDASTTSFDVRLRSVSHPSFLFLSTVAGVPPSVRVRHAPSRSSAGSSSRTSWPWTRFVSLLSRPKGVRSQALARADEDARRHRPLLLRPFRVPFEREFDPLSNRIRTGFERERSVAPETRPRGDGCGRQRYRGTDVGGREAAWESWDRRASSHDGTDRRKHVAKVVRWRGRTRVLGRH